MPTPGFNLGNTLESTWGYAPPTQALINSIADAGFKTLRVPCAWDFNSTNGTINAAYMTEVANVVDWALAKGMYVIINDHWDNGWFERRLRRLRQQPQQQIDQHLDPGREPVQRLR